MIRPSGSHPDILTIRDAVDQVRDIFDLAENDDPSVTWKLVSATTNTPLTIAAELVAMEPNVSPAQLDALANGQTKELKEGFAALERGNIIPSWLRGRKATILRRMLNRSLNGIGRTDVQINDESERETITPLAARMALRAMDAAPEIDRARAEVGSLDGEYLELGTHYAHPALKLRERKTGAEIWCWVSEGDLERFSEMVRAADVWRHKRVRARGKILYDRNGGILHVEAQDVQLAEVPRVTLDDVRDPYFTAGLSVSEYLNRLREGTLG
ncbi:MAG TPA: hypothetical protein VK192_01420 [Sphingomicrobium sp.]|nr:hypothetical protein [Sphingomicrobium sp.]